MGNVASGEGVRRSTSGGGVHQASPGNGRRSVRPAPPRRSSSGSLASTVAAKRRQSKTVEVIGPHVPPGSLAASSTIASKRGYECCSKREKSSALAALIGCISLATLMTSLVTDLWLDTDEAIPAIDAGATSPDLPNVQPRHEEGTPGHRDTVRRVHFAVGLWTVCPSHGEEGYNHLKGTDRFFFCYYIKS